MALFTPSESPAVVVKEVDLTSGVPNVQSSTGAFVGNFAWGPVDQVTLVSNEAELAEKFGTPAAGTDAVDFLSAAQFLRYSNKLQIVRAAGSAAKNAHVKKQINFIGDKALVLDNKQGIRPNIGQKALTQNHP